MSQRKGGDKCLVNATVARSRFFSFFSVQENEGEYKSLIAITEDNSCDRNTFWRKRNDIQDCSEAASVKSDVLEFADSFHNKATNKAAQFSSSHQRIVSSPTDQLCILPDFPAVSRAM